jgi:peptidoglycan hydrolase-like protein with peptidoglycan-binding domain
MNRPIGFGSLWNTTPAPTPSVPATPTPAPAAPKTPVDTYKPTPRPISTTHERFANDTLLANVSAGTTVLAKGLTGPTVQKVQQALDDMAFVIPSGPTGFFGPETEQAVKNFQSAAKLPVTGKVDQATLKALEEHAPPSGKKAWSEGVKHGLTPSPKLPNGKLTRVVVDLSSHRLFLYDKKGELSKIYGVRTGNGAAGNATKAGIKIVDGKNADPRAVSNALWPESGGKAFGTRLLNLSDYDVKTGKTYLGANKGQELHGTFQDYSIGRDFSHGCVGLRNQDIEEIYGSLANGELIKFQN